MVINKQNLAVKEKQAQIDLIESTAPNSLLTGLGPKKVNGRDDILTTVFTSNDDYTTTKRHLVTTETQQHSLCKNQIS